MSEERVTLVELKEMFEKTKGMARDEKFGNAVKELGDALKSFTEYDGLSKPHIPIRPHISNISRPSRVYLLPPMDVLGFSLSERLERENEMLMGFVAKRKELKKIFPLFITNFGEDEEELYKLAIELSGEENLIISKEAFAIDMTPLKEHRSLHFKCRKKDLEKFWSVFDKLSEYTDKIKKK